jgi:hypothetical protein
VPKLPEPPPRGGLAARLAPDLYLLPRGSTVWRLYYRAGSHPAAWNRFRSWGPAANMRFDHHLSPPRQQTRSVLYGALLVPTCFAEVFQDTRTIERSRNQPWLVAFGLTRDVELLDLMGNWPTRAGASMAIATGRRDRARRWSLRIYEDYLAVEGLRYGSSMDASRPAVALYERALGALPLRPLFHRAVADPALDLVVSAAARRFSYLVVP